MSGYDFHPEARIDLDEIWEFIRADNLNTQYPPGLKCGETL
jgi:hypothetical protein